MIVITLARKPMSQTMVENISLHGVGGLNIGACRIKYENTPNVASNPLYRTLKGYSHTHGVDRGASFQLQKESGDITINQAGRWPANIILKHSLGCVRAGTGKVKGHKGYPNGPGGSYSHAYQASNPVAKQWNHFSTVKDNEPWPGHADADGMETIEQWACVEGCPVKALDHQVGIKPGMPLGTGPKTYGGGGGFGGHLNRQPHPGFGDIGFVSRFFKQVQSKSRSE